MRYSFILLLFSCAVALAGIPQAPLPDQAPEVEPGEKPIQAPVMSGWLSPEPMPDGAVRYESAKDTQAIYVLDDGRGRWNMIDRVPIAKLEAKWQVSGGMVGLKGWKSEKYRTLPAGQKVKNWTEFIAVRNSFGVDQQNKAIRRSYPDGTRFDDVLSVDGIVFEHRTRVKADGKWRSEVVYEDRTARPTGYNGLSVSCASCHSEAGTGKYGEGLVPGGDTVISEPLAWAEVWVIKE